MVLPDVNQHRRSSDMPNKKVETDRIGKLMEMSPADRKKIVNKMPKNPRGDMIILLLGMLQGAHKRTTRAKAQVQGLQTDNTTRVLRQAHADAEQQKVDATNHLRQETLRAEAVEKQLMEVQTKCASLEKELSEQVEENERLTRGYNYICKLKDAELSKSWLLIELAKDGFEVDTPLS